MTFNFLNLFFNHQFTRYSIYIFICFVILFFIIDLYSTKYLKNILKTKNYVKTLTSNDDSYVTYRKVIQRGLSEFKGTIFIFPPTGGENIIDRLYARDLALLGYEVFILKKWSGYELEGYKYELHNVFYGSAQRALEKVQKLASTKNMSILGTSVGALHASIAMTSNPNIKSGFLIVGGLPIPELIVHSKQQAMVDLKKKRYDFYGLRNDTQYVAELSLIFEFEPTKQKINFLKGKKIAAIVSKNDDLVPYKNQKIATEFFKSDPIHVSELSHTKTVAQYGLLKRQFVLDFFRN